MLLRPKIANTPHVVVMFCLLTENLKRRKEERIKPENNE